MLVDSFNTSWYHCIIPSRIVLVRNKEGRAQTIGAGGLALSTDIHAKLSGNAGPGKIQVSHHPSHIRRTNTRRNALSEVNTIRLGLGWSTRGLVFTSCDAWAQDMR